jgi:hypothetical protein
MCVEKVTAVEPETLGAAHKTASGGEGAEPSLAENPTDLHPTALQSTQSSKMSTRLQGITPVGFPASIYPTSRTPGRKTSIYTPFADSYCVDFISAIFFLFSLLGA